MAGLLAVLKALARAERRDLGSFGRIKTNNFFLFIALLVWAAVESGVEPQSAEPLMLLLGLVLLFPLSSDPLNKLPRSRRLLWPLSPGVRFGLRISSLLLSPVFWFAIFIVLKTHRLALAAGFAGGAMGIQMAMCIGRAISIRAPAFHPARLAPGIPGSLRELTRNNVRQIFQVLDTYAALLLSAGATAYRFLYPHPDPAAFPILALIIPLTLSTYAQCLFGLDVGNGLTRYRILPLRGWRILFAKDLPFLAVASLLVLPLDLAAGLTFSFMALAIGHHSSVLFREAQQRWRFTGSRLFPGVLQAFASVAAGFVESRQGWIWLLAAAAIYCLSVRIYGRVWDRLIELR